MARQHPRYFLPHMTVPDSREGTTFHFATITEEEATLLEMPFYAKDIYLGKEPVGETSWGWQRDYLDFIIENPFTATLKARQLGVSWIWDGAICWDLVFFAGIDDLVYSIKEDDAIEQINRIWDLWLSLPDFFKYGLVVNKPFGGARPSNRIEIEHPDGRMSTVTGMPATKKSGHSRVARRVLFDEGAHQEFARPIWKAIIPAAGDSGGNIGAVSTANGMSDGSGGGNFFHELYSGAGGIDYPNVKSIFLDVFHHPLRDERWYSAQNLDAASMAEQYPRDDDEAFLLTGNPFFDLVALHYYAREARVEPLGMYEFKTFGTNLAAARLQKLQGGPLEIYRRPTDTGHYFIGADCATGDGKDYSVAAVIDLSDGAPCAELRMKADYTEFTRSLHFLGRYYNNAWIAPEKGGGYGDVVIAYLRDGHEGRKPYARLYRHRQFDDPRQKTKKQYGFPMTRPNRAMVISELNEWVNKKLWPWLTKRFRTEARTFVRRTTGPSPAADDGANDDSIMAWGIALAGYARYGTGHAFDRRKQQSTRQRPVTNPLQH
jgi:hypothetical protein